MYLYCPRVLYVHGCRDIFRIHEDECFHLIWMHVQVWDSARNFQTLFFKLFWLPINFDTSLFCFLRAAGSGGCVGTGFWITIPCPSVTSGEACPETLMLLMRGTTAGSSSSKVSNSHTDTHVHFSRGMVLYAQVPDVYALKDDMMVWETKNVSDEDEICDE